MSNKFLQRAVSDVGINVGSVNVNTDTLEAKMETTNTSIQNLRIGLRVERFEYKQNIKLFLYYL